MDDRRFDQLARLLGATGSRRLGLRAALAGLLGTAAVAAGADMEPEAGAARRRTGRGPDDARKKKRKKRCNPECGPGYECVKDGKERVCRCPSDIACGEACCAAGEVCLDGQCKPKSTGCDPACANGYACVEDACVCPSGVVCGAACCEAGQACQDGSCGSPRPVPSCIEFGERCKNAGLPCCSGLVCASGPGGESDVACYRRQAGGCTSSAECAYGLECRNGQCQGPLPVEGVGVPCNAAAQQQCSSPGATCSSYTTPGAPAGSFCALPVGAVCTGDPQCTCYRCDVPQSAASVQGRRGGRAGRRTQLACCQPRGGSCATSDQCCLGLDCDRGTCGGAGCSVMASQGGAGLQAAIDAAAPGAVITIEGGTYDGSASAERTAAFLIEKPITLRACRDTGEVILRNAVSGHHVVYARNAGRVVLEGLTVTSTTPTVTTGHGVYAHTDGGTSTDLTIVDGRIVGNARNGVRAIAATLSVEGATTISGNGTSGIDIRNKSTLVAVGAMIERNNTAVVQGGGLYVDDATARMTACTIRDNQADFGGGIRALNSAQITLAECTIQDNRADWGGGMYANRSSQVALTESVITGNVATSSAGGIMAQTAAVTLTACRVTGNRATNGAGGLYANERGELTLDGTSVTENTVGPPTGPVRGGAGVTVDWSTLTLKGRSRIGNNTAVSTTDTADGTTWWKLNWGGGIMVRTPSVVNVEPGSTIDGNHVTPQGPTQTPGRGGGIYVFANAGVTDQAKWPKPTNNTNDLCGTLGYTYTSNQSSITFDSSIVFGNTPDNGYQANNPTKVCNRT